MFECNTPEDACAYALERCERIPVLERLILKEARAAYKYARDVIKGRWPEAEPIIFESKYAEAYAKLLCSGESEE